MQSIENNFVQEQNGEAVTQRVQKINAILDYKRNNLVSIILQQ